MSFLDELFKDRLTREGQEKYNLARQQLDKGHFENALRLLEEAETFDPGHQDIQDLRKDILLRQHEQKQILERNLQKTYFLYEPTTLRLDRIQHYTNNDFRIEAVAYGQGKWRFVFRRNLADEAPQQYLYTAKFTDDSFEEYDQNDYFISKIGSDGTQWFAVMEYRPIPDGQYWVYSPGVFPKEEFDRWSNEGFFFDLIKERDQDYFLAATFPHEFEDDVISEVTEDFPDALIRHTWKDGDWIQNIFYLEGRYHIYYGSRHEISDQSFTYGDNFPVEEILEKIEEGYHIQQLLYVDQVWIVLFCKLTTPEVSLEEEEKKEDQEDVIQDLPPEPVEPLEDVLAELDALVGLDAVKEEIHQLVDYLRIGKLKSTKGITTQALNLHMTFSGNPGTGKTTVARLIGRIYRSLGLVTKGHVVETDRSGLVAEYVGQTAARTLEKIQEAEGGILFIDEAYALHKEGSSDFGRECLETLIKSMEDRRTDLVVIMAGYPDEMRELLESNPGLKSRFATHLHFADFSAQELMSILKLLMVRAHHQLSSGAEAKALKYLDYLVAIRNRYFGNAREMRNLFEDLLKAQSSRLADEVDAAHKDDPTITIKDLQTIRSQDVMACYSFGYREKTHQGLDEVLEELDQLIGLDTVKTEVTRLAHYLQIQKQREKNGWKDGPIALHTVFMGPPGTGKTTVARLMGKIYKALGILNEGHLIEASRSDFVAEYVGQTAIKTNKLIDRALHGLLFIDEAYALSSKGSNDFGAEAVEVLLKRMEDNRDKLVVIAAGYPEPMEVLLESNPGLRSRFSRKLYFDDYSARQLYEIFELMVHRSFYKIEAGAESYVEQLFEEKISNRERNFGNARWVRNFFERCKLMQAQRLSGWKFPNQEQLQILLKEDLKAAYHTMLEEKRSTRGGRLGYRKS